MENNKLFLLDAYALIYRAYYALIRSPRVTSTGRNTSAIYGFCTALDDIIRRENPRYMAVCFDPPGGQTFRHEVYPEYKAGREKQPEDITASIPVIKDIIRARGIKVVEVEGYEADDVIGTLAVRAQNLGLTTYMMTPDKDYGQLVTDHIFMYRPGQKGGQFEIRGPQQVCERYGISSPLQVIDLLALEGDAADNVPGCPGVGEKTAVKLIAQWGSVDNLIENAAQVKGALGQKIRDNAQQILFSKYLVTINTGVPVGVEIEDLRRADDNISLLTSLYTSLEFKSLISRLPSAESAAAPRVQAGVLPSPGLFDFDSSQEPQSPTHTPEPSAPVVDVAMADAPALEAFAAALTSADTVAMYILADGDEAMRARIMGIALYRGDAAIYLPAAAGGSLEPAVTEGLRKLLGADCTVASHSLKRDMILLHRANIPVTCKVFDTSVAHYVLKPEASHHLADVAMTELGLMLPSYTLSATERRRTPVGSPTELAAETAANAAAVDALVPVLGAQLGNGALHDLFTNIEMPLVGVLSRMEITGVRIDSQELAAMSQSMTTRLENLEKEAFRMAGAEFNLSSPAQVGEILFGRLAIDPKAKRTKTGAFSTTEEILEKHRSTHPIVDIILQYRSIRKLQSTYIDALPRLVNPSTGKIHTTFNQTVTATGRLSSTNPNLQNIPVRTEMGREIRRAFIADPGCLILSADYSQIELRLMAHLSADEALVEAFTADSDIHRATAAKIFHIAPGDVTDNQRRIAKTANFGIIYGISAFGLSERLAIPRAQAKALIDGYMATYPGVAAYMEKAIESARSHGYVETALGRRRYLPDINSRNSVVRGYAERNAVNAPLQGTAADIIKIAMVNIDSCMRQQNMRSRMIMQVHDELIFNVHPHELIALQTLVVEKMQQAFKARVPLTVSAGVAPNWLEAH